MSLEEIVSVLKDLRKEVLIFPSNDILVNLSNKPKFELQESFGIADYTLKKIGREAINTEKNSGINPVCISEGTLLLKINSKEVISPVFLNPAELIIDSKSEKFSIIPLSEQKVLNPFLITHFNISVEDERSIADFDALIQKTEISADLLNQEMKYIGNFHPKRFSFLREIEHLIYEDNNFSDALKTIYGNDTNNVHSKILTNSYLFNTDQDQLKVFEKLPEGSVVVQGPPGTGKSQVIGNLIANVINSSHNVLLISEKKVALDVIQHKLNSRNLGILSFQIPSKHPNRSLIFELKKSWDFFIQMEKKSIKSCFQQFENQRKLYDILIEESKFHGCTISSLVRILEEHRNVAVLARKRSNVTLSVYENSKHLISEIPSELLDLIKYFKPSILDSGFSNFIEGIEDSIDVLNSLHESKKIDYWKDLKINLQELLTYHSFNTSIYNKFGHLISIDEASFKDLQNKYYDNKRRLNNLELNQEHWLIRPTLEELKYLKKLYAKRSRIYNRFVWFITWRKWTRTSGANPENLIKERIQYIKRKGQEEIIVNKLFKLGIKTPESELPIIDNLINSTDKTLWFKYLNDKDSETGKINHKKLYRTLEFLKHCFDFDPKSKPLTVLKEIEKNKSAILEQWSTIKLLPNDLFPYLASDKNSVKRNFHVSVIHSLLLKYPELKNFTLVQFVENCKQVHRTFESESNNFADNIKMKQYYKFQELEKLTKTSPRKLSEDVKLLRQKLKKGKSILIKEFGKKRSHKSIRSLFQSDAFLWIQVLKPIWMANPNVLSSTIPLKKEQFDYVIADEASQLLLSHSIGALHRGKKAVICGDPQQMAPSSYFKKKQSLEIDLLHHANYYLNHVFLSNHYRSFHPGLIQFSNTHFYNNKLKAFQHTEALLNPLQHHFIENGRYSDRVNLKEAEEVSKFISQHVHSSDKLGIVAFSEAQLDCIYDQLNDQTKMKLEERINADTAFFQALEKVQGDECDRLIISFGYGYNPEDKFEMRFGPVNYNQGHKRLNVLFSRAKKKIDFFSSVKYGDFPVSQNEGVNLIKKWFYMIENDNTEIVTENEISIYDILDESAGFHDLISYINVYSNRGYTLVY